MMRSKRSSGITDRYSALSILRHAVTGAPWPRVWRNAEPKAGL